MKKLLVYLADYKKESIFGPLFKLLEASFELLVPLVVAAIIDTGIKNNDFGYILKMCLILVGLALIGMVCAITAQFFAAKAAVGFSAKLRSALFRHIQSLSHSETDSLGLSTLITRITSDINQVQAGVNLFLRLLLRSPFVVIGAMVMAFFIDARCAMIFVGVIPVLAIVVFGIMLITMPMYKNSQKQLDIITRKTRENITGARVIRAFGLEEKETEEFSAINSVLVGIQKFAGKISALMNPVTYIIINIAVIALIYSGAVKVELGQLKQGEVVALYNYMSQILVELVKMANMIITITKAVACSNRIADVFEIKNSLVNGNKKEGTDSSVAVEFENASFCYNGSSEMAVENLTFKANQGDIIGIIGGTASGKTSLVNLIPRFYDVSEGTVRVEGVDVREYDIHSLRRKIGFVHQKAVLFKGTIESNLKLGNQNAEQADIETALEAAQIIDSVKEKGGTGAVCEQNGRNFSGGQKQRLTIARALVKKPEILILDDSASALDYITESKLRNAIAELGYNPTVFIVSQRASSVMHADKIIVLDDGKAVGIGTHTQLLESCETYKEIYSSQFE